MQCAEPDSNERKRELFTAIAVQLMFTAEKRVGASAMCRIHECIA